MQGKLNAVGGVFSDLDVQVHKLQQLEKRLQKNREKLEQLNQESQTKDKEVEILKKRLLFESNELDSVNAIIDRILRSIKELERQGKRT